MLSLKSKGVTTLIVWTAVIQFAFICGVEAVFVSVFTGTTKFDSQYKNPSPSILGLITALYPVFAALGAFSTLIAEPYLLSRTILQIGSFVWLAGFLLGAFHLTLPGILGARAIKGYSIGLITSMLAPYIESIGHIVTPAPLLTSFQGLVPFALMMTCIIATFLHHYSSEVEFNLCWLISAAPALLVVLVVLGLPAPGAEKRADENLDPGKHDHQDSQGPQPPSQGLFLRLSAMARGGAYRKVLKACMVQVGVQLTGVNFVLYYTSALCKMIGFGTEQTRYIAIGLYGCNFVATLISVSLVSRVAMAKSLKYSAAVMSACHGAMYIFSRASEDAGAQVGMGCVAMCFVFMAVFSIFFNGISFVYTSAIVPQEYKSLGVGLAIGSGWLANAVLSALVPLVMARVRGLTFMLFAWSCSALYLVLD